MISRFNADKALQLKAKTVRLLIITKREYRIIVKMSLKDRFDRETFISHAFCDQTGKLIPRKLFLVG